VELDVDNWETCLVFVNLAWLLVCGHFVADFALQTEDVSLGKDIAGNYLGLPWYYWLIGHAATHGLVVSLVTGFFWLGMVETAIHATLDRAKSRGLFGLGATHCQLLQLMCKVAWAAIAVKVLAAA
jgi:hypothetical protein